MKKKIAFGWLMVFFAAVALISVLAWANARGASVSSSPLDCYAQGQKTVCFDGKPSGQMTCEMLDQQTMICTTAE